MPELANTVIGGRYRLERQLGAGGMGEVWAATDTRLDRPVAVKIVRSGLAGDPGVRLRFESEARSAARLHHPNVVAVFDAGADVAPDGGDGGRLWLVMERLPGPTLVDRLAGGRLSSAEVRAIAIDTLAGLAAAHEAMLVHRDIKPGNLLQAADGNWKVADFGIAKPLDNPADLTMTGVTIGTPSYLSPEQLEGRPATPASDVWAVAVVLYEALAGRKPFAGDTPFAVADAVRTVEPEPIAAVRPDADPALAAAITAAMAKDPSRRPRDATAMGAMLHGPVAPVAPIAPTSAAPAATLPPLAPPVRQDREREAARRRRLVGWITALAVAVAVLIIGLVAGGVLTDDRSPSKPSTTTTQPATTVPTTRPSAGGSTTTTRPTSSTSTSTTTTTKPTSTTTTTSSTTTTTKPTSTTTTTEATTAVPTTS